jgi:hypothetical protein
VIESTSNIDETSRRNAGSEPFSQRDVAEVKRRSRGQWAIRIKRRRAGPQAPLLEQTHEMF